MKLYDRVQFADGTTGLILSMSREGERTILNVLTDEYKQINCDPDQVGVIERKADPLVTEDHESGGSTYRLYTFEVNMLVWYRMAVWHDYWIKHPAKDGIPPLGIKRQQEYWDNFEQGNVATLPEEKNIRRSEATRPHQESMNIGVTHDH